MLTKLEGEKGLKIWLETPDFLPLSKYKPTSPEEFIIERSCFGCSDSELEDIKAKPFIVSTDLKLLVQYENHSYSFTVPKGFTFNGANVPAFAWVLIGQRTDPRFKLASCVHDWLCENHADVNYNRYVSTLIFITFCQHFGRFNKFKCWAMKHSVDNFQKLWGRDLKGKKWKA